MTLLKPFPWYQWHHWNHEPNCDSHFCRVNYTAKIISAVSRIPLKRFQRCRVHCWNHCDSKAKHFMGISTTKTYFCQNSAVSMTPRKWLWQLRFQRCHWHRWNSYDTAEISNRLYESLSSFKGKITQNISMANIPILYKYLNKKSCGLPRPHFRFQLCHWHRWNWFWRLWKRTSRRIRGHMRNCFSLLIRGL
jgi:hypothetical protein